MRSTVQPLPNPENLSTSMPIGPSRGPSKQSSRFATLSRIIQIVQKVVRWITKNPIAVPDRYRRQFDGHGDVLGNSALSVRLIASLSSLLFKPWTHQKLLRLGRFRPDKL